MTNYGSATRYNWHIPSDQVSLTVKHNWVARLDTIDLAIAATDEEIYWPVRRWGMKADHAHITVDKIIEAAKARRRVLLNLRSQAARRTGRRSPTSPYSGFDW